MSSTDTPPLDAPSDAELDFSDATSSFITIPSSIRSALYRYENGKRYSALNTDYKWPCDASHARFELLQARLLEMTYETGLYWEPSPGKLADVLAEEVEGGQGGRILDIGSGVTASWAISMAERFPQSEVIGVDLVPSELEFLPPNLTIEIHDCLEGLPHPDDFFSLIHIRMIQSIQFYHAAPLIFEHCSRCLRPGGILLLEEPETAIRPRPDLPVWPGYDALLARHQLHGTHWVGAQGVGWNFVEINGQKEYFRPGWAFAMASYVGRTPGFGVHEEGKVLEDMQQFDFGSKPMHGPPEKQRGSLVREIWLLAWQLNSEKEPDVAKLKEEDKAFIPEEDVGLYFAHRVVWAEKGRKVTTGEAEMAGAGEMLEG